MGCNPVLLLGVVCVWVGRCGVCVSVCVCVWGGGCGGFLNFSFTCMMLQYMFETILQGIKMICLTIPLEHTNLLVDACWLPNIWRFQIRNFT